MRMILQAGPAVALMIVSYLFGRAFLRCRRLGRGPVSTVQVVSFAVGLAVVVVALFSPLEAAAERSLAAHMLQHVLLLAVPLPFLMARTGAGVLLGIEPALRSRIAPPLHRMTSAASTLWRRPVAWALLAATLAVWHLPAAFQAAATSPLLHTVEHLTFLTAAGLWWLSLVGTGRDRRTRYGGSLLSVFGTMLLGTAVGALLTFSATPWYPLYADRMEATGGDWLNDQQLAGLIMWIPPGILLLGVFAWLAATWLRAVDTRTERATT